SAREAAAASGGVLWRRSGVPPRVRGRRAGLRRERRGRPDSAGRRADPDSGRGGRGRRPAARARLRCRASRGPRPVAVRYRAGLVSIAALRRAAQGWRMLDVARGGGEMGSVDLGFEAVDAYAGRIDAFSDRVRTDAREKSRVLIVTQQERRLRELLEDRDVYPAGGVFVWAQTPLMPGLVVLGNQPVAQGFRLPSQPLEVYGDTDLFGGLRQR